MSEKQPQRVKHNVRVTSDDVPGTGMARRAGRAIEENRRRREKALREARGD